MQRAHAEHNERDLAQLTSRRPTTSTPARINRSASGLPLRRHGDSAADSWRQQRQARPEDGGAQPPQPDEQALLPPRLPRPLRLRRRCRRRCRRRSPHKAGQAGGGGRVHKADAGAGGHAEGEEAGAGGGDRLLLVRRGGGGHTGGGGAAPGLRPARHPRHRHPTRRRRLLPPRGPRRRGRRRPGAERALLHRRRQGRLHHPCPGRRRIRRH